VPTEAARIITYPINRNTDSLPALDQCALVR